MSRVNLEHMVVGNITVGIGYCWLIFCSAHGSDILWATPCLIAPIWRSYFTCDWMRMRWGICFHWSLFMRFISHYSYNLSWVNYNRGHMCVLLLLLRKKTPHFICTAAWAVTHMVMSLGFYTFKGVEGWQECDHRQFPPLGQALLKGSHGMREFMGMMGN